VRWSKLSPKIVNCAAHRKLALQAARESMVLLKNEGNLLPLKKDLRSIAVIGPTAFHQGVLLGNYNGLSSQLTTLLQGIIGKVSAGTQVQYNDGRNETEIGWITNDADVIIAMCGFTPEMEGEASGDIGVPDAEGGGDRLRIGLPAKQLDLLQKLHATGKPVVLVLTGGSPIELNWTHENIPAILMTWYPGECGGVAAADVLFGDYNPAGRLPLTFIKSLDDIPIFTDYNMQGRTYRFMKKAPLFRFGFGLSYSRFSYANLKIKPTTARQADKKTKDATVVSVQIDVKNVGSRAGDEVVQVYVSDEQASVPVPRLQLAGFRRIHLRKGAQQTVRFNLTRKQFMAYDEAGVPFVEPRKFKISVGGGQPDDSASGARSAVYFWK